MADPSLLRFLAFYLPQFHPIPENDRWWGPGFTEWTNVVGARPLFRGHEQPDLPGELGFYDLRVPEVRAAQAGLARAFGIDGFCYYHYWFGGKRLLERPFDEVLRSGEPDFPFCLCWANENWTRAWNGGRAEVLLPQTYSAEDDLAHIRWLTDAFADRRYVRVGPRPLLLVYRPSELPDPLRTTELWRSECERLGAGDPYLCGVGRHGEPGPAEIGFDAMVRFAPDFANLQARAPLLPRVARRVLRPDSPLRSNRVLDYQAVAEGALKQPGPPHTQFPCVTPGFDNSPRRRDGGALILTHSRPERYEAWLSAAAARFEPPSADENLFFVNAWNEWAEGNHLEPSARWERSFLAAHARARSGRQPPASVEVVPARTE